MHFQITYAAALYTVGLVSALSGDDSLREHMIVATLPRLCATQPRYRHVGPMSRGKTENKAPAPCAYS